MLSVCVAITHWTYQTWATFWAEHMRDLAWGVCHGIIAILKYKANDWMDSIVVKRSKSFALRQAVDIYNLNEILINKNQAFHKKN